jgi:hypothetical protein
MARMPGPDTTRSYTTRNGDRVILHEFVPQNSLGDTVTFPIIGTIRFKGYPRKKKMQIWTLEGRADIFKPSGDDIIDLPPVLKAEVPGCADCHGTPITPPAGLPLSSSL